MELSNCYNYNRAAHYMAVEYANLLLNLLVYFFFCSSYLQLTHDHIHTVNSAVTSSSVRRTALVLYRIIKRIVCYILPKTINKEIVIYSYILPIDIFQLDTHPYRIWTSPLTTAFIRSTYKISCGRIARKQKLKSVVRIIGKKLL